MPNTESRQPESVTGSQDGIKELQIEQGKEDVQDRHQQTHFSSFVRKWESKIPAARMMSMTSKVEPRRRAS